jgi:diguanylate cyclase (GGDEF)-like protein
LLPLALVPVIGVAYVQVPAKSATSVVLYDGFLACCVVAVAAVAARRPHGQRHPWWLVSMALASFVAGDLGWYAIAWVTGAGPAAASAADIGYLAYYPMLTLGLGAMLRRRSPGRDLVGLMDAAVLATGVGLIVVVFLVLPNATGSDQSLIGRVVAVGYPLMDLALLAVAVRLVTARGNRPSSFLLLIAGVLTMFAADLGYGVLVLNDAYIAGGWLDLSWPASHALVTAAALHPSASSLLIALPHDATPSLTRTRLLALAAATLLAPLIAAIAPSTTQRWLALQAAAVLFLLVLGRLAGLTRTLSRTEARFRSLVEHGADPILVLDPTGTITFASPAWRRLLGEDHPAHGCTGGDTHHADAQHADTHQADALSGDSLTERLHPDCHDALDPALRALAAEPIGATRPLTGRLRHTDGTWRHVEATATNRIEDPAVRGLVLNVRDVTERAFLEEQLREAALHDPLTRLPNRALFTHRVEQALTALDPGVSGVAVLFVDMDDFKQINDTLGHAAGDQLLTTVADRLRACVRPTDTIARLGGDEFAVLLPELTAPDQAHTVAARIDAAFTVPAILDGRPIVSTASIGLAFATADHCSDDLLRNADLAMYAAKHAGKAHCATYHPDLLADTATRHTTLQGPHRRP